MNIKASVSKLLTNKTVLIIVVVIAFLNVVGYLAMNKINDAIGFVVIALITRYFSKNMVIVLGVPLLLVNLTASTYREGLEDKKKPDKQPDKELQDKINALLKDIKVDNENSMPIMAPLQVEGFDNEQKAGVDLDSAYSEMIGELDGGNLVDIQSKLKLLEKTKKMSPVTETLAGMGKKLQKLMPHNM